MSLFWGVYSYYNNMSIPGQIKQKYVHNVKVQKKRCWPKIILGLTILAILGLLINITCSISKLKSPNRQLLDRMAIMQKRQNETNMQLQALLQWTSRTNELLAGIDSKHIDSNQDGLESQILQIRDFLVGRFGKLERKLQQFTTTLNQKDNFSQKISSQLKQFQQHLKKLDPRKYIKDWF